MPALIILGVVLLAVVLAVVGVVVADIVRKNKKETVKPEQPATKPAREKKAKPRNVRTAREESPVQRQSEPVTEQNTLPADEAEETGEAGARTSAEQSAGQSVEQSVAEQRAEQAEEQTVETDGDDNITEVRKVVEDGNVRYIIIKYSKSFLAKLIQADGETKRYYSELKNFLLDYGVKSRISWKHETFRSGRNTLVKLVMRGKTLSVALACDPLKFEGTKYHVESFADIKAYAETPCIYRIKNDRRLGYAKELIDSLFAENGLYKGLVAESHDYAADYPYESTQALVDRKLIRELTDEEAQSGTVFKPSDVRGSVTAQEADSLMRDDVAEMLVERTGGVSDRTRTSIVNIDTLSRYFEDGETVTLEEVKKRVPEVSKRTTYLKVLARGTLDKALTVEADSFSLQAVKMIVLTGGTAVRK